MANNSSLPSVLQGWMVNPGYGAVKVTPQEGGKIEEYDDGTVIEYSDNNDGSGVRITAKTGSGVYTFQNSVWTKINEDSAFGQASSVDVLEISADVPVPPDTLSGDVQAGIEAYDSGLTSGNDGTYTDKNGNIYELHEGGITVLPKDGTSYDIKADLKGDPANYKEHYIIKLINGEDVSSYTNDEDAAGTQMQQNFDENS